MKHKHTLLLSIVETSLNWFQEEYKQARKWVACNFNFPNSNVKELSIFEINIRYVGGFLAAYALSGDHMYIEKAQDLVDALLPAFDTPSGIPKSLYNPNTGGTKNYNWAQQNAILAEFGTLDLEFQYLSDVSGVEVYYLLRETGIEGQAC